MIQCASQGTQAAVKALIAKANYSRLLRRLLYTGGMPPIGPRGPDCQVLFLERFLVRDISQMNKL